MVDVVPVLGGNSIFRRATLLFLTACFYLAAGGATPFQAISASPLLHKLIQPDGKAFEARQWGDEWLHGWETAEGYTIVLDRSSGYYFYAEMSGEGTLQPSVVRADSPPPSGARKSLRPTARPALPGFPAVTVAPMPRIPVPTSGTLNIPILLANFSDTTPQNTQAEFTSLLFDHKPDLATGPGSLRDYYQEISYQKLSLSPGPSGVGGWYTVPGTHDSYGSLNLSDPVKAAQVVADAATAAYSAGYDFSQYDANGDGIVDALVVVHQGTGQEASGVATDIWSHRWRLSDAGIGPVQVGSVFVDDYILAPERLVYFLWISRMTTIGVFAHELGHIFGLPDLYDIDNSSYGDGAWEVMAGGAWNAQSVAGDSPAHMGAWCKDFLGWVEPVQVSGTVSYQSIHSAEESPEAYQILWGNPVDPVGEYFLIENRQRTGFDIGLPDSGLLIWHIDESRATATDEDNSKECYPGGPSCAEQHYRVALVQADGQYGLEKKEDDGSYGDPFYSRSFDGTTTPNSDLYSGVPSGAKVSEISASAPTMVATLVSPLEIPSLLQPPDGTAMPAGTTSVEVKWGPVVGATAYTAEVSTESCGGRPLATTSTDQTTWTVTGLTDGLLYFWRVRAAGDIGASPFSNCRRFTVGSPRALIAPTILDFGNQLVSQKSDAKSVFLTNQGSAPLMITGIAITGPNLNDFGQSNTCGESLAIGANCTLNVTFTPGAFGSRNATLALNDNAGDSPQTVTLRGTGTAPMVSLSSASLVFDDQLVGQVSPAQTVTLTNSGTAPLHISGISTTGGFAEDNNCQSPLAVGGSCVLNVKFAPTQAGTRVGSIAISDDAPGSPQLVNLSGRGVMPGITISTPNLSFGDQRVNSTSSPQTLTLTNSGTAPLNIWAITVTSEFAQTNDCATAVAPGARCTIAVTFTPAVTGLRTGTLTISDDAPGNPHLVSVKGTGTAPAVSLSAWGLTFEDQVVGANSPAKTTTLTNTGTAPLTISTLSVEGDFSQSSNCPYSPATVAVGGGCILSIVFSPTVHGYRQGRLKISDDASNSPQYVTLAGNGLGPDVGISTKSLSFSSQVVGTISTPQRVTLWNTGNANLSVSGVSASGDFSQTHNCTGPLAPAESCNIDVTFTPIDAGSRKGTLVVTHDAPGSPHTVDLSGIGSDFAVSSTPTTLAIMAGEAANYSLKVIPEGGFRQAVALNCTGNPLASTCSFSQNSVTLYGTDPVVVTMTVSTTGRSTVVPRIDFWPPVAGLGVFCFAVLGLGLLARTSCTGRARRRAQWALGMTAASLLLWTSCGRDGGDGGRRQVTPSGSYTLTITATSGDLSHKTTVTLNVN